MPAVGPALYIALTCVQEQSCRVNNNGGHGENMVMHRYIESADIPGQNRLMTKYDFPVLPVVNGAEIYV